MYIEIANQEEWQNESERYQQTYLLFKHSTTCPISAGAHHVIESFVKQYPTFPVLMVKVIESRPLSLHLADHFAIEHASPQVILVKNGEAVFSTSHNRITGVNIEEAMQQANPSA